LGGIACVCTLSELVDQHTTEDVGLDIRFRVVSLRGVEIFEGIDSEVQELVMERKGNEMKPIRSL